MARLEAVEKGLYYPTPLRVMELIGRAVPCVSTAKGVGRLLDICAGEGDAAVHLADMWGLDAYGVELDANRAAAAQSKMTCCLRGSYHCLHAPEASFSAVFLNPPYDYGQEADGVSMRQEIQFLSAAKTYLAVDGLLVYVPPRHILHNTSFVEVIRDGFKNIECFQFPEPERSAFDQVVVIARRSCGSYYSYSRGQYEPPTDIPTLGESEYCGGESIVLPVGPGLETFEIVGEDPAKSAPRYEDEPTGAYASAQWDTLMSHAGMDVDRPLLAPRAGHQAMLLASGTLNGTELDGKVILKGSSEKIITVIKSEEAETVTERERIVSRLSLLNLESGDYQTWRVDEDPDRTTEWFEKHGDGLARAIQRDLTPAFAGDLTPYQAGLDRLRAPGVLPGHEKPEILPLQKLAGAACAFHWNTHKSVIIDGEMGTGKTTIAIVASELAHHEKVVVVCPTHLVRKWIRECETITGEKGVAVTATSVTDVDDFFTGKARYLVLSKERAKLGARWRGAYTTKKIQISQEVVDYEAERNSGYSYYSYYRAPAKKIVKQIVTAVVCPDCGEAQQDKGLFFGEEQYNENRSTCIKCKGPMWQSCAITAKGTKRWALAKYINQHYARRFSLVMDEAHQYAKADTDQSRAIQHLVTAAKRVLAMTGTLYGGRASSLFYLLHKLDPAFRRIYKYTDCGKFVSHHGLFETVYAEKDYTSVYGYRRGKTGGRIKEVPGMNPAMIGILLPSTVFVKLKDLQLELPPYKEEVVLLDHRPDVEAAAVKLGKDVRDVLRKYPKALGAYLMACLGYPDRPDQEERIVAEDGDGLQVEIARAPSFAPDNWPKDNWLVDLCVSEKSVDRKVLVYFTQTHRRDARQRIRTRLEERGLKVAVLDADVAPEKREEWMFKELDKGFDVLLTNGRLVETGLDLIFAATVVQFGTEYSINSLRQSIRRSWRLGQRQPVRVIFVSYRRTMQEAAMNLIARKTRAAEMVDGDDLGGLARYDEAGTNFFVELAQEAVGRVGMQRKEAA